MREKVPKRKKAQPAIRPEKVCTGRELAKALKNAELTASEARKWRRDLQNAHKILKAPRDRWR